MGYVHCHVGSLESGKFITTLAAWVHCHVGSLETAGFSDSKS